MGLRSNLISEEYRRLNIELHSTGKFGVHGSKWAERVTKIAQTIDATTLLDYGCGQGSLGTALALPVAEYDPAIEGKDGRPEPADLVICTDVLEHIEPEFLDNVVNDLCALSIKALFTVISTRLAKKMLADGRNAHLIVEPPSFWREIFSKHFTIVEWEIADDEIIALMIK